MIKQQTKEKEMTTQKGKYAGYTYANGSGSRWTPFFNTQNEVSKYLETKRMNSSRIEISFVLNWHEMPVEECDKSPAALI